MAKKRRDKERDSSSVGKIAKVGTAALAIGGGVAVFNNSGLKKKFNTELLPSALKTTKAFSKELRDSKATRKGLDKRNTLDDYKKAFQKGKNAYHQEIADRALGKKVSTSTSTTKTFAGNVKNVEQTKQGFVKREINNVYKSHLRKEAINNLINKYDDKNANTIIDLATDAFNKVHENAFFNQRDNELVFSNFMSKRFKKAGFSATQEKEFLTSILDSTHAIEIASRNSSVATRDVQEKSVAILNRNLTQSKKRSDTLFGKVDSWAKKHLGKDIDSEMFFSGDRAMTLGDFKTLANDDNFDFENLSFSIKNPDGKTKFKTLNVKDILSQAKDLDDDIIFDKSIRVQRDGSFYSTAEIRNIGDQLFKDVSDSTLGKMFWMTDVRLDTEKSLVAGFKAYSTGKEAGWELNNQTGNTLLHNGKLAFNNASTGLAELYETTLDENGRLILSDVIAEGVLKRNDHGKSARLTKEMVGTNKDILTVNENKWLQKLDLDQGGAPTPWDRFKGMFNKQSKEDYLGNVYKRQKKFLSSELSTEDKLVTLTQDYINKHGLSNDLDTQLEVTANIANLILEDNKTISSNLNSLTALHQINDETISSLLHSGTIKDEKSLAILDILNSKEYANAEELLNAVASVEFEDQLYNTDLENIYNRGINNSDYIMNMLNISQTSTKNIAGFTIETTNVMDLEQVVKREAIKEVLLRESSNGSKQGIEALENILNNSNLDLEQSRNLRYLGNWSIMQTRMRIFNDIDAELSLDQIIGQSSALQHFDGLLNVSGAFKEGYLSMIDDLGSRLNMLEPVIGNINQTYSNEYNAYSFMKKSALSRIGQIESINDAIKIAGEAGKELLGGRNNLNDYTTLTQLPQFMLARLAWGVEGFGLNFSHNSTGSTLDYAKNIALKRVLPVMGAFALYDYMDYESENFTGTSITGATANALANVDIASRKLAYSTGVGQVLNWFKGSSVIGEYWTDSTNFQTAEEREDWYENGYTAVRGGRLWGFGSTSEYRGGNIQYFQQNYLRRAHSNYNEVGVYGSAEEKFKHSWLPSLRHPLSPLRAALDPYWLEKKNMDERPYPLTGKMFSEGTPWGAILNPTVGELLKPVRTLPEVRKRLGNDGRDIKSVLEDLNTKIKRKGNKNKDALLLEGTDIRNAEYVPYGNTGDNYMNINISNGSIISPGVGYMNTTDTLRGYRLPSGEIIGDYDGGEIIDPNNELIQEAVSVSNDTDWAVNKLIGGINDSIRYLAEKHTPYKSTNSAYVNSNLPDRDQATYSYVNAVSKMNIRNSNYYSEKYDPKMINKNVANDYLRDASNSIRELSGIYNFLGGLAFGEDSYSFKYEDAGAMTSFSRTFWDSQVGGIGGGLMEIGRRFFPSEDKSVIRYNPLRNSMPEWLPERFLTGDAFTSLPKGEMRMPGKGYETLNELHPDEFGEYGAFDRFKILADVAPTSQEYKTWRNIARNTITDPDLIEEMEAIQERAGRMSGKHEFFDYRYYNNNIKMNKGVVKSINGSIVELVSGEQLNLAGINLTEEADITQLVQIGQHINYRTSADAIKRLEEGLVTNAVIYKTDFGMATNINKTLVDYGMAERDTADKTALGYLANSSGGQQTLGALQEFIGHARIPFLHNKYMKIETARESFVNEQIYGNPFTTWDHPIRGFVMPAFNNASSKSIVGEVGAIASTALYSNITKITNSTNAKYASAALMIANNPTALLGAGIAGVWDLGVKASKVGGKTNIGRGAEIGAAVGTLAWGWNNAENPLKAVTSFAMAGESLASYLKADSNGKWGLIGAGIGLGISALKNPSFSKDMFRTKWLPGNTEKKYEIDEYFDRLDYVKYQGLFNQAAIRAFIFEGNVNMHSVFKKLDKNKEKIAKLTRKAEKLSNKYTSGGYEYNEKIAEIDAKIEALQSQRTMLQGGKYTKAAVAYKKAMESTIYGLSEGSTQDEILSAVPDQYKDYYINFMNESSASERKKILKMLPEYLRRPLQIAWNEKPDKVKSNNSYFKKHALPGMGWRGWKPNVNLKHVKMKTIQNEGMLLSDFGYYESEKSKMSYHMADDIDNYKAGKGGLSYMANMASAFSGLGVSLQNISVEPTSAPGLWIVGDIKQTASDVTKVGQYGITSGLQGITSLLF